MRLGPKRIALPETEMAAVGERFAIGCGIQGLCCLFGLPWFDWEQSLSYLRGDLMTADEELEHLDAELERLQREHPNAQGVLRLTDKSLRGCSKWKWEQHGWTITDPQTCGIMNGNDRERRTALLAVLKGHIYQVEIVPGLEMLEVVPDMSS